MKKSILTTLLFAVLYFLCMGIGVLLGNLFDQTGNMFYAPAFTALVGGGVYMILSRKSSALWSYYHYRPCHRPLFLGN